MPLCGLQLLMFRTKIYSLVVLVAMGSIAQPASAARPWWVFALLSGSPSNVPQPPVWPESYTVRYNFSIPYMLKIQPHGLT